MTTEKKARVWHINGAKYLWQKHDWCEENQLDIDEQVKVIEMSAFTALEARCAKLKAVLESIIPLAEMYDPPAAHKGSCGPDAGCDQSCANAYYVGLTINEARAALAEDEGAG